MNYAFKSAEIEPGVSIYSNKAIENGLLDLKAGDSALVYMEDGRLLVIGDKSDAQTVTLYAISDLLSHNEAFRASICKWICNHQEEIWQRMSRPVPKG